MERSTILVVGSLNMDEVVQVPRLPMPGETLLGAGSLQLVPGGKGANQAVAIARLGGRVRMAGRVGTDPFGQQLLQSLKQDGVESELVEIDQESSSGVAFIFLSPAGENAIVVSSGANGQVGSDEAHYQRIVAAIPQAQALVLQLEIPLATVTKLVDSAYEAGTPVILNLAPAQQLAPETLEKVSVLIVNESEASLLSGEQVETIEEARTVATKLHQQGIGTVVITLGSQGAILVTSDKQGQPQSILQAAPKVKVQDTTAAGDCFVGALAVALTTQQTPTDALRFAVTASALKVTKFGAQPGLPTLAEVQAHLSA